MPYTGVCKWFNQIKGNGVIVHEDLNDAKLNGTEIVCDDKGYVGNPPKHGDRLFYELEWEQERERFIAVKVTGGTADAFDIRKKQTKKSKKAKRDAQSSASRWAAQSNYGYQGNSQQYNVQASGSTTPSHGPSHASSGPVHVPFAGSYSHAPGLASHQGQRQNASPGWQMLPANALYHTVAGAPVLYM